ncbi:hypothetical protein QSV34_10310 [Porticoccus sp. W117]|uniref:hypothetical protein n=1 Tax=Porticoccus sp. W117 TaxID=3054777 RepID=UPI002594D8D6|nr:hypothetical protein [Porticoccus sp. W117]MDM3871742.1 hypothetical protein [Porticoccus sp. W117]
MRTVLFSILLVLSWHGNADTLKFDDLVGEWEPSGEFPASDDLVLSEFEVLPSGDAVYKSIGESGYSLMCKSKKPQSRVYVFDCFTDDEKHLITLSVSGWSIKRDKPSYSRVKKLMYGFEYWLSPSMNGIYGGVPVSFKPKTHTSKGSE